MNKKPVTLNEVFREDLKDPEFLREVERLRPYYDLIVQIVKRRNKLGLTQEQLADRAETHQARISKIESGETDFRFSTLISIATALAAQLRIQLVPLENEEREVAEFEIPNVVDLSRGAFPALMTSDDEIGEISAFRNWRWTSGELPQRAAIGIKHPSHIRKEDLGAEETEDNALRHFVQV